MINQNDIRRKLAVSTPQWGMKGTHAGLWLDKYIAKQDREDPSSRSDLIDQVSRLPEPEEYEAYFEYWQKNLNAYSTSTQTRQVRVNGRMVVGLGSESVLETSICLHRTYGLPYIPGSAIKGLAANYAHQYLSTDWQKGGKFHTLVFGNTDDAGYITFFDALYVPGTGYKGKSLYPDVITVHHPKYYQDIENEAPSDSDNPNPVPFLSATGTYLFALAALDFPKGTRWIDLTFQLLAEALEKVGIGAKTSSGYGRMVFVDPAVRPLDPEIASAQGYKREIEALKDVAGQIHGYYQKWKPMASNEARIILARAIIEKVQKAGREKVTAEKPWYKELQAFLSQQ
jgi:CRISPR-associated protein Cmr6